MNTDVSKIRDTLEIAHKIIPMMNDNEIIKLNLMFLVVCHRLEKEGRIDKEE